MWAAMERTGPPKKSIRFDAGFPDASPAGCRLRRAIRNAKTHQCEVKASNNAKNIAIAKTRAGRQVTFAGK